MRTTTLPALAVVLTACAAGVVVGCTPREATPVGEGEGEGDGCIPVSAGPVRFSFKDDVSTHFQAQLTTSIETPVPDHLVLQFFNYNERIGDGGIGSFPLNDEINDNYGHCMECLLVFVDQLQPDDTPTKTFFQSEGTIALTSNPRETSDLLGTIRGLKLVESTIGGDPLESTPVPGGACLVVADIVLDLPYLPPNWTCAPERYEDGECDCDCGDVDTDCFVDFGEPPPAIVNGCEEGQACSFDFSFPGAPVTPKCVDTCDVFNNVGCDGQTVCILQDPQDLCDDDLTRIDPARLGEACGTSFDQYMCNVVGTVPGGLCNNGDFETGEGRTCQPLCESAADCEGDQFCYTIVGGSEDGTGRGYCEDGEAP